MMSLLLSIPTNICRIAVVFLVGPLLLHGCHDDDSDPEQRDDITLNSDSTASPSSSDPIRDDTLTDAYGSSRIFTSPPTRAISFAPNLTEIVHFIGAGDRLVARTDYCNYPPDAKAIESIGTLLSYNYERLIALRPDIILMMTFDGSSRKEYDRLKSLGLQPFALAEGPISEIINGIDTVATIFGRGEETRPRTNVMRRRLDSLRTLMANEKPTSVFVVIESSPLITVSKGFIDEMITAAGGRNIAAGEIMAYPRYSREVVLRKDPEVILVSGFTSDAVSKLLDLYPEWKDLKAGRNGKIVVFDSDLLSRPGPRLIEGIIALRRIMKE